MFQGWEILLKTHDIQGILLHSRHMKGYVGGLFSDSGWVLITENKRIMWVDGRYYEMMKQKNRDFELYLIKNEEAFFKDLKSKLEKKGIKRLGVEFQLGIGTCQMIEKFIATRLVPIKLEGIRQIKNQVEIDKVHRAAAVGDRVYRDLKAWIKPGISEKDIAGKIYQLVFQHGGDQVSFEPVVVSGERGAMPHGKPSDKRIAEGELLTIDFGVVYQGYCSDMTRTIKLGKVSPELEHIFEVVNAARAKGIQSVKAGIRACEVHEAVSRVIEENAYGSYFPHGTGHGVGLQVHEGPIINAESEALLEEGMIITIEPGIYIPGLGGVRIEDMVLVGQSAGLLLTQSEREGAYSNDLLI